MKMQIETEIHYQPENRILTAEALVETAPIVAIPPPGLSASRSPASAFPAAIFGVDDPLPQSVETSELLFETLDHEELANIAIQHTANMDDAATAELNTPTVDMSSPGMTADFNMEAKDVWTATAEEPLYCANPMEIEGRDILDAPIYFADQEPAAAAAPVVISIPETPTKARKKLRLIMPKPAEVASAAALQPAAPTTPEVVDAIEKSLQKNSDESIDLLAYVTDSTIKVDDPSFLAYIGSTTPG